MPKFLCKTQNYICFCALHEGDELLPSRPAPFTLCYGLYEVKIKLTAGKTKRQSKCTEINCGFIIAN
jgi:hypothetical protein